MPELPLEDASPHDVARLARRRGIAEAETRAAMELADAGTAWCVWDGSEPIALAVVQPTNDAWHLGDLYVEPSYRGQGLGGRLVDAAFAQRGDASRSSAADADDRAGLALLLRRGIALRELVLRLAGAVPKDEILARMAAGDYRFSVEPLDPLAHAFALDALDRDVRGIVRNGDHRRWSHAARGAVFSIGGEVVGYAYVWPDGRIGPLASTSAAYLTQLFAYALVTLRGEFGGTWCTLQVPASNARVARAALRAGLLIEERLLFASDAPAELSRYVGGLRVTF